MKGQNLGEFEELVLLALRHRGGNATVVDLQETLAEVASRRASMGHLYSALDRLQRKGFVSSALGEPSGQRGGKRRRVYTIDPSAEEVLEGLRHVRDRLWSPT